MRCPAFEASAPSEAFEHRQDGWYLQSVSCPLRQIANIKLYDAWSNPLRWCRICTSATQACEYIHTNCMHIGMTHTADVLFRVAARDRGLRRSLPPQITLVLPSTGKIFPHGKLPKPPGSRSSVKWKIGYVRQFTLTTKVFRGRVNYTNYVCMFTSELWNSGARSWLQTKQNHSSIKHRDGSEYGIYAPITQWSGRSLFVQSTPLIISNVHSMQILTSLTNVRIIWEWLYLVTVYANISVTYTLFIRRSTVAPSTSI